MSTFKNVCRDATQFKIQSEKKKTLPNETTLKKVFRGVFENMIMVDF
jgi:hypothetical protein